MGTSLSYCHVCGAANVAGNLVCSACGHALVGGDGLEQARLLKNRYQILVQVGTGGFGAVYKALDTFASDSIVAIKQINLYGLTPQEMIEATDGFNREVRILSGLQHPSLPRIHDTFTDAEHWYLVMGFIEGETLEEYLKKRFAFSQRQGLPVDEVLAIGLQLCPVLNYLHTRQPPVIFRDLKPSNLMRTLEGKLFLIDFGIARLFTPGKAKDTIPFGSPGYAAPEQYGKAQTTPQADIYSMGALLHQLLTGDDPAESPFRFAMLGPQDSPPEVGLDRLIQRMVDVDASRRPVNIGEVQEELERLDGMQVGPRIWRPSELPPPLSPAFAHETSQTWQAQQQQINVAAVRASRRKFIVGALAVGGIGLGAIALPTVSRLLSPTPVEHLVYRGHSGPVTTVALSPDGQYIASGSADKTVQVWRAADAAPLYTFYGHQLPVTSIAWSEAGRFIASTGDSDGTVQVWEPLNGHMDITYEGKTGKVLALSCSLWPFIASGGGDKTVQVWDAGNGGTVYTYRGHSGSVKALVSFEVYSSGEYLKLIASASADKTVQVWQAGDGSWGIPLTTYRGHIAAVNALDVTGIFTFASASDDGTVQIWDASSGARSMTYRGHRGKVNAVRWLRNSPFLIASAGEDKTVQVWDSKDGNLVCTYNKHSAAVRTLDSDARGRIVSGSDDGTVHLWTIRNL